MEITLQRLTISGFKGINTLDMQLDGHSAIISGANGTGKTSVYDAALWLLFGKDSADTKADVKPVDDRGERVSGKDVDVTARYEITDNTGTARTVTLRKQLREVWSKPAGGAEQVYTRDETLCWINDVPMKVDRDYVPEVIKLFGGDESTFKLLSSYTAFMAQHWTDRRRTLLKMTGASANVPGFEAIGLILMGNTPEDAKKRLMEQRKRQNEALDNIPSRIDELQRSVREVTPNELEAAKQNVASAIAEIDRIDLELSSSDAASKRVSEIISRKSALERRKLTAVTLLASDYTGALAKLKAKQYALESGAKSKRLDIERIHAEIKRNDTQYESLETRRQVLLAEHNALQAETYVRPIDLESLCPHCGQLLPEPMIEESAARHLAMWNTQKATKLEKNIGEGRSVNAQMKALTESTLQHNARIKELESEIAESATDIALLRDQIADKEAVGEPTTTPEIEQINADIATVEAELSGVGTNERAEELAQRKRTLNAMMANSNAVIATAGANEYNVLRIAELEREKKTAGAILASIERDIHTLDQYVTEICKMLESSINAHFTQIRWKLFDTQKNGEIKDCCDATVNGVTYGSGLNNAAEVNAGIEVIRVMSELYDVHMPCFVDNAESVNRVASTGGQMVLLQVTEEPKLTYTLID